MFKKVLVVEDLDTVGYGISMMLKQELDIKEVTLTQYCDDAYLKFKQALNQNKPFELLITDLSFKKDHRPLSISSGKLLIEKIRNQGYEVPIIICSVEEKASAIKRFLQVNNVSGYVLKGRDGLKNLHRAIEMAHVGKKYLSPQIEKITHGKDPFEIGEYDVSLLAHLSYGLTQDQISVLFCNNGISPNSLSTIEKRLNKLKDVLKANNNVQLVANAKDLGLI
ncbi:MAG: DUF5932 domain-containing protein [Flavobacteriaceae bacterium]